MMEKTFEDIYKNVFNTLKSLFGDKSESLLIKEYEKEIINKGKGNYKYIHTLNEIIDVKKKYKTKKAPTKYSFERLRKDSVYLIQEMTEYAQRKDLGLLQKTKVVISFRDKDKEHHAELFLTKPAFLVSELGIKKIEGVTIHESNVNELNTTLANFKGSRIVIDNELIKLLKKELGEFDISL